MRNWGEADREEHIDLALARAAVCLVLRLGFQNPQMAAWRDESSDERKRVLEAAAKVLGDEILPAVRELTNRPHYQAIDDQIQAYDGLFGHTARGVVCLYETEYGSQAPFLQSQDLADITGYFLAFGLESRVEAGERVDHIAVEWEYLGFLAEKEAYALQAADLNMLEDTRKAYHSFLANHLARFAPAVAAGLVQADPKGFYGGLGILCKAFVTLECKRLGIAMGPEFLTLRPESLDDAPMACGTDSELVQIE